MTKNFFQDGKWIEKTKGPKIAICAECDGKYIPTRPRQKLCLRCLSEVTAR